jgi:RNA polymerase sigma factor (sigma-70 family)
MDNEDSKIISQCLNGEPEAFGMLVDKYKAGIYAYAYAKIHDFHEAQDMAQEVFLQAYRSLHRLKKWESFSFWLNRIAYNLCRDWKRSQQRKVDTDFIEDQDSTILENPSFDSYRDDQMNESLQETLESLPDIYREVLTLYYFGGMDSVEIAQALGTSPANIRQRLSRAREQLKEEIIAMMGATFKEQKLQAGFTFRIVEAVKRIKVNPIPTSKGIPWGLSLATCAIVAIFSLNPALNSFIDIGTSISAFLPMESKVLKVGEIPVDVVKISNMAFISAPNGKGKSKQPNTQNALSMAPKAEGGTWAKKADMPTARTCPTAEVDGKIYAIGGTRDMEITPLSIVEEYDPKTDTWTKKADMPTPRMYLTASAVNGKIYAIGGKNPKAGDFESSTVEEYDPKTNIWTKKADMPTPRALHSASVVNGKIYVIGSGMALQTVEEYNPIADKWTKKADMPTGRWLLGSAAVNDKIYAIGGNVNPGFQSHAVATVEEYDPSLDKWTKKADMPDDRTEMNVCAINDKIYVIAGGKRENGNIPNLVTYVYEPSSDKWTQKSNALTMRASASGNGNVVDGKIYIMGGMGFDGYLSSVEEYTPEDWQPFPISLQGKLPSKWGQVKR